MKWNTVNFILIQDLEYLGEDCRVLVSDELPNGLPFEIPKDRYVTGWRTFDGGYENFSYFSIYAIKRF